MIFISGFFALNAENRQDLIKSSVIVTDVNRDNRKKK